MKETTTTTPSAETPSATTPSAIPSAKDTSDVCISWNNKTYKDIKYELTILETYLLQFNDYLSRHEVEWRESYKEDEWYMEDLFHASSLHTDVSLLVLRGIESKLEKLGVQ